MSTEKKFLNDFSGGLVAAPPPWKLSESELRTAVGVFITRRGGLNLREHQRDYFVPSSGSYLTAFTRYTSTTSGESSSYLIYEMHNQAMFARLDGSMTDDVIQAPIPPAGFSQPARFAQMYNRLFWTDGQDLRQWIGSGAALALGIEPPANAAIPSILITPGDVKGAINGVQYYYTFVSSTGAESNPSPISAALITSSFGANITVSGLDLGPSGTVARRVYRTDDLNATPVLVETINDNVTTSFNDSQSSSQTGTTYLNFSHDVPPETPVYYLAVYRNRLVLADYRTLYVSTKGGPDYFPTVPTDPTLDGARFDIDSDDTNPIRGLSFNGSVLIVGRLKNMYALQGDDYDTFSVVKIADVGCVSADSMKMCGAYCVWLSPDGTVYALGDTNIEPISLDNENRLDDPALDLSGAQACYWRQRYLLYVPRADGGAQGGIFLCYDFRYGKWSEMHASELNASRLYSDTGIADNGTVLFAAASGYSDSYGHTYTRGGIVEAFVPGLSGLDWADFWSADYDFGMPAHLKKADSVRVRGTSDGLGHLIVYGYKDNPGANSVISSGAIPLPAVVSGVLIDQGLPAGVVGHRLSFRVLASGTNLLRLEDVEIGWEPVRPGRLI